MGLEDLLVQKEQEYNNLKFIAQNQTGIDTLLIEPENDTSVHFELGREKDGKIVVKREQLPFKNLNTRDLTTANLSPTKLVSVNLFSTIAIRRQVATMYFSKKKNVKVRYNYVDSQGAIADKIHTFCSATKGGLPMGGMLVEGLKTKTERVFSNAFDGFGEEQKQQQAMGNQNNQMQGVGQNASGQKPVKQGWKL